MTEDKSKIGGIKRTLCEVFSRVTGYIRPVSTWNKGKQQEWADRKEYKLPEEDKK